MCLEREIDTLRGYVATWQRGSTSEYPATHALLKSTYTAPVIRSRLGGQYVFTKCLSVEVLPRSAVPQSMNKQ